MKTKKCFFVVVKGFHEREATKEDLQKIRKHFMTAYVRYQSTFYKYVIDAYAFIHSRL